MADNLVLGRGEIHFARFKPGTRIPTGERYLGNSPEFSLTIEGEMLDHFNSDRGIREKDNSITLQTNRSGSMITDNISPENLALFFFGTSGLISTAGGNVSNEAIADVEKGLSYQLGQTSASPTGARNVSAVTVEVATVAKTAGTDYTVDLALGRITILATGSIANGDDLVVDYTVAASTRSRVISGSTAIEGAMRYIAYNAAGENTDLYMPYVKITPNGDFAFKGDEWQQLPFTLEVLRLSGQEAIYADGRAYTP